MSILQMPVRQIGWMINSIARASTCGGRLFNVLDLEPSIADKPGARTWRSPKVSCVSRTSTSSTRRWPATSAR